jgi:hypothetical protein
MCTGSGSVRFVGVNSSSSVRFEACRCWVRSVRFVRFARSVRFGSIRFDSVICVVYCINF